MPNPIKSMVQDYVTTTITHKVLGGGDNKQHSQQQHHSSSGGVGGILGKISSTIGSTLNPGQQQHNHPQQQPPYQQQQMSGSGYPGGGGYGAPPPPQSGYQPYGGGAPQGGYASGGGSGYGFGDGYPPQSGGGGSYSAGYPPPQQQQQPPYPGYPPSNDYNQNQGYNAPPAAPLGFNVDPGYPPSSQPSYGAGGNPPYGPPQPGYNPNYNQNQPYPPPSTGGGAPYGGGYAPSQQQPQYGQGQQQQYGGGGGYQQQPQFPPGSYSSYVQPTPPPAMATPSIRPNPNFNAQHTAELLRKAMKGFGCDNDKVIQALVNCNNAQRQEVIRVFKQMYGKDLISELKSELRGDFEHLILALMEHPARYDAQQLRRAMEGLGTKEHVLIEIMTTRNNAQIQQIKMAYYQMYGGNLEQDLVGETSGHFKRLLVSLCSGARDESMQSDPIRANQDAHKLYRAGEARLGTDESAFNAILAAQNYNQLRLVLNEYKKVSGHSIEQAIVNEFSGDIKDGLLAVVKSIQNRPAYFAEMLYNSMKGFGTRDTDLIRLIVSRSEIDLADIRNAYQQLYGVSLEQAITSDCSGSYKNGLIAIVKGFYH